MFTRRKENPGGGGRSCRWQVCTHLVQISSNGYSAWPDYSIFLRLQVGRGSTFFVHCSDSNGCPRFTHCRSAATSVLVSVSLTKCNQSLRRVRDHAARIRHCPGMPDSQRQMLNERQPSARGRIFSQGNFFDVAEQSIGVFIVLDWNEKRIRSVLLNPSFVESNMFDGLPGEVFLVLKRVRAMDASIDG